MAIQSGSDAAGKFPVNLRNENLAAVIENPLGHLTDEQLVLDVRDFAQDMEFLDILDDLVRGARLAQNPLVYDDVARGNRNHRNLLVKLEEDEKTALMHERDTLLFQSSGFYMTILTVSLAAILQGFVQSSINGADLFFPKVYGLDTRSEQGQWIEGVTNAAPFWFAAILGCPLVDPIARRYGRLGAIRLAAILIVISSLGSAFCNTWGQLFACRIFNGIGMGLKAASTPILASESSVSFWRGTAALCWQLWVAFGIMIGFVVNLLLNLAGEEIGMRLILGAPFVPSLALIILTYWCPESPRWHMINGDANDYHKAYDVFLKLRKTKIQALRDLYLVHKQILEVECRTKRIYGSERGTWATQSQLYSAQIGSYFRRFTQLFSKKHKRLQNALLASCTVNLSQQLCGINVLAFYSGNVFSKAGNEPSKAMLYSFGFGAVNFLFGLPAIRNIDTLGRRTLLLGTLPFMSLSILAAGLCFYIPKGNGDARNGMIAFFLYLFAALYSPGLGPMPFTLASEAFPLSHREAGVAVSVGVNLFVAGLLTVFYPRIQSALGDQGSLGLFSGLNIIALVMIFLWVPETKQRSLEELDLVFAVPTKKFVRYQVKEFLPWAVKRYLLGKDVNLNDLYEDRIWKVHRDENDGNRNEIYEKTAPRASIVEQRNFISEDSVGPHERIQLVPSGVNRQSVIETASISSAGTHD